MHRHISKLQHTLVKQVQLREFAAYWFAQHMSKANTSQYASESKCKWFECRMSSEVS